MKRLNQLEQSLNSTELKRVGLVENYQFSLIGFSIFPKYFSLNYYLLKKADKQSGQEARNPQKLSIFQQLKIQPP